MFRVWSDNSKLPQMPHRENYSVTVVFSVKPSEIVTLSGGAFIAKSGVINYNHSKVSTEKRKKKRLRIQI